jgi:hypothetical protein
VSCVAYPINTASPEWKKNAAKCLYRLYQYAEQSGDHPNAVVVPVEGTHYHVALQRQEAPGREIMTLFARVAAEVEEDIGSSKPTGPNFSIKRDGSVRDITAIIQQTTNIYEPHMLDGGKMVQLRLG